MNRRKLVAASSRTADKNVKRVLRALEEAMNGHTNTNDPIVEQLKQCPEAFKVGEILGKAFDSLKYAQDGAELLDRYLPPAGMVLPPLV
ncbi:MAG: hypothetical protein WBQ43_06955 [Terriglobales bacterium]